MLNELLVRRKSNNISEEEDLEISVFLADLWNDMSEQEQDECKIDFKNGS